MQLLGVKSQEHCGWSERNSRSGLWKLVLWSRSLQAISVRNCVS